jgi:D-alanine-D-alanine ligase
MISENRKSKIRVVVLFGGESAEHDVSCVTAAHVLRALDPQKYEVSTVGITREGRWVQSELPQSQSVKALSATGSTTSSNLAFEKTSETESLVVIPLLHGPMGEDGTVQGLLELAHVAYVGSGVLASAVAMDKSVAKQIMSANGIAQQKFLTVRDTDDANSAIDRAIKEFGLPMFVKPANMGSSIGVSKVKTRQEADKALAKAFEYDEWVLIEEAITGREIEVAVLGNESPRASVPGEIVPSHEFYDYDDKYVGDSCWCRHHFQLQRFLKCSSLRSRSTELFAATAWLELTSFTKRVSGAFCATRSTQFLVLRRSLCIQSFGKPQVSVTPS